MDATGKELALSSVAAMQAVGQTDLPDGLLRGLNMLRRPQAQGATESPVQGGGATLPDNCAVLLFSDSRVSRFPDGTSLLAQARRALSGLASDTLRIFSFGFGETPQHHGQLRNLANAFNGQHHALMQATDVQLALSECIATLVPIVATDAVLRVQAVDGESHVARPLQGAASYQCTKGAATSDGMLMSSEVQLGNLYLSDAHAEKDLLMTLHLPSLDHTRRAGKRPVLQVALSYTVAGANESEVARAEHCVERPTTSLADEVSLVDVAQRGNFIAAGGTHQSGRVALAIERATKLCRRGRFEAARELLRTLELGGINAIADGTGGHLSAAEPRRLLRIGSAPAVPRAARGLSRPSSGARLVPTEAASSRPSSRGSLLSRPSSGSRLTTAGPSSIDSSRPSSRGSMQQANAPRRLGDREGSSSLLPSLTRSSSNTEAGPNVFFVSVPLPSQRDTPRGH